MFSSWVRGTGLQQPLGLDAEMRVRSRQRETGQPDQHEPVRQEVGVKGCVL